MKIEKFISRVISKVVSKVFSIVLIFSGLLGLFILREANPFVRLLISSIGMIWLIKVAALIWQTADGLRPQSRLGVFLFLFAWPGVSFQGFQVRGEVGATTGSRFFESWLTFLCGCALLVGVATVGRGEFLALNYVGLLSIMMIVHLGLVEVVADGIRLMGFSPRSLFDRPFFATSLRDFWSHRWNRAFVDMNKIFLLRPLKDKLPAALLTFSIFAVSGVLHEMGISYPDGVSWGMPLLYFVIQGIGMELERHFRLPRVIVFLWLLLPVPLLFTFAFTDFFVGGLAIAIAGLVDLMTFDLFYRYGLIVGGFGHLLVLCASVQVPGRLGWNEDFQKLRSMNRKIVWTYGLYIFAIIFFLSVTSFLLSGEPIEEVGTATLLWLVFISIFWCARLAIDQFYMNHNDWPQGPLFTVGHTCLTTLFISLAVLYSTLAITVSYR